VKYIEEQDGQTPFYLYLTFNAPHTPYQVPESYRAKYAHVAEPTRRTYCGMVDCLDENIGRVVAALEKKGLRGNTLILFHSDNGGVRNAMFAGQMTDLSKTVLPCDNGPYKDGKGTYFEGGVRVAACANWPGKIKAGEVTGMIHAADILPTLVALAGGSTAKCKPLDGYNVWDVIAANQASPRSEMLLGVEPYRAAVRQGDFKLIWRTPLPEVAELYDIAKDPGEKTDLAASQPAKVLALKQRANELASQQAKPLFLQAEFGAMRQRLHLPPALPGEEAAFNEEN
jgi:arylsulfatase A-like enzyme